MSNLKKALTNKMNSDDAVVERNPVIESLNRNAMKKDKKDKKNRNNVGNQKKNLILSKGIISDGENSNNEVVTNDAVVETGTYLLTRPLTLSLTHLPIYLFIYLPIHLFTFLFCFVSCY